MNFGNVENLVKGLLPHAWSGKHEDGSHVKSVEHVDCGLNPGAGLDWVSVRFTDTDGVSKKLMATTPVTSPGTQGGNDHITLAIGDGPLTPVGFSHVDKEDFVLGLQFSLWPPGAAIVFAYKWLDSTGKARRTEFKGNIPTNMLGLVGL